MWVETLFLCAYACAWCVCRVIKKNSHSCTRTRTYTSRERERENIIFIIILRLISLGRAIFPCKNTLVYVCVSSRRTINCHRLRSHIVHYFYRLMISKVGGRNLFLFLTFGYVFRTFFKLQLPFSLEQKLVCVRVCNKTKTYFLFVWMMVVSICFTWFYAKWSFCSGRKETGASGCN